MFAVVYLPDFPLQTSLRHEPELWSKPIALVDSALSTPRIIYLTEAARASGVVEGLTPTQALARCREISIRSRSLAQESSVTEALLQVAYGFSPNVENSAPGACTLDLRGLAELKNAEAEALVRWAGRIRTALTALNLRAQIGLGPTPNIARHAAVWGQGLELVSDPIGFVRSLPVAALDPSSDVTLILQKWGIRTVGDLLALGQNALADRIGLEALALFAAASTTASRPLNLARPAQQFEESFEFEHEIETLEPLLFILRRFTDQIDRRLDLAGLVAELLVVRLRLESGEMLERRLRVPQPTRSSEILFRMLHTHLESLRTESPIVSVALKAEPTQPEQKQFSLFEAALRDPHQFQETLARLSALLGAECVGTPVRENSHRPDAFKLIPPDFENAPSALERQASELLKMTPLRRLRPAVQTSVRVSNSELQKSSEGASSNSSSRPVSIHCKLANGQLKMVAGPWRSSGNWWEPGEWRRDEWDVATRDGEALRLVHRPDGWFVEGMVD